MKKVNKNSDESKDINFIKKLVKSGLYFISFCISVFAILYIGSYFWLEGLKLDMDDMMSFD